MRRLFWKEWRENWLVVVCTPLLLALFMVGYKLQNGSGPNLNPDPAWLIGLCAVAAVIIGAGLFAREIGNETLGFLLSQPVNRRRVWAIKCAAGLIMLSITSMTAVLVWSILQPLFFRPLNSYQQGELNHWGPNLLIVVACFIVSLAVSTLLDRSLAAAGVALAACFGLCIPFSFLCFSAENLSGRTGYSCTVIIIALSLPAFIAASYRTFTRGESLRTPRRFVLAGTACAVGLAIAWAPPFATCLYLSRFHPVGNAVTTPSLSPDGRWLAIQVLNRRIPSQANGPIDSSYMANHLVIERPDGSGPRYILPGGQPLAWSADGRYLIYWQFRGLLSMDREYHAVLVETATGRIHSIDRGESSDYYDGESAGDVAFSPNGRWLAIAVRYPAGVIYFYDLRRLAAGKLMPYSGITDWHDTRDQIFQPIESDSLPHAALAWSSDSRLLYYECRSGGLSFVDGGWESDPHKDTLLLKAVDMSRLAPESDWNYMPHREGPEIGDYTLCSLSGVWPIVSLSHDPHRALVTLISHPDSDDASTGKSLKSAARNEGYVIDLPGATQAAEDRDPEEDPPTAEKWLARMGRPLNAPSHPVVVASISPDGRYLMFPVMRDRAVVVYETAHPDVAVRKLPMRRFSSDIYWLPDGHSMYLRQQTGHWAIVDFASGAGRQLLETGLNPIGVDAQGHLLFCDKVMRNVFRPGVKRTEDGYEARAQGTRRGRRARGAGYGWR